MLFSGDARPAGAGMSDTVAVTVFTFNYGDAKIGVPFVTFDFASGRRCETKQHFTIVATVSMWAWLIID